MHISTWSFTEKLTFIGSVAKSCPALWDSMTAPCQAPLSFTLSCSVKFHVHWVSDGDCSHEIERCLLLGRKAMTNLDSILKSRGDREQVANICWIIEKVREFQGKTKQNKTKQKNYFFFIDYDKVCDCVDHNKLWKILKDIGIPNHLTHLLRNLYWGKEATVRRGHRTMNWFQIEKGWILSTCLFIFCVEYIMWNARLDET